MLDELAKVICCPSGCKNKEDCHTEKESVWQQYTYKTARAVLTRLMEPTPKVIEKLQEMCAGSDDINTECWTFLKRYRAMLRAAMEG